MSSAPVNPADGPVYFLSDAHIGAGSGTEEAEKEKRLLAFLSRVRERASALVLLGDLFDFWFQYRHAIPSRGFRVLADLQSLIDSGIPVQFLGGNHDFWAGPFLKNMGMDVVDHPVDRDLQGRRLFLAHGDGVAPGDTGYRILRRILRNRLAISAYRLIHPDLGIPLATSSSTLSRKYTADIPVIAGKLWKGVAEPQFNRGRDAVLIGHFHHAIHVRQGGRDFIVNGDWMTHWTFTVLDHGTLTLYRWPEERIEPQELD